MATVVVPALLRGLTAGRERVEASGHNVREIIADLERQFPGFSAKVIESGDLRPSVAVSIDGEIATGGLLEEVSDSSEVHFLPAIGGGY